ncbi:hypothetical protein [Streptomyces malaysiensis]|uniref:hypothetical protein n=1 Tax=Streptomyces malaysiensis TaxID=92644 RepID=UPI002B2E9622|nr:hypothetical protein R8789_05395 [Streptomyces malaysiensis]
MSRFIPLERSTLYSPAWLIPYDDFARRVRAAGVSVQLDRYDDGEWLPLDDMYTMWPPVHAPAFGALRRKAEEEVLGGFEVADPKLPVVADQSGELLTDAAGVRTMLLDTFNRPIRWPDMVATMREQGEQGITKVCIAGPDNLFGRVTSTGENFEVVAIDARKAMRPRVRRRSARRARR